MERINWEMEIEKIVKLFKETKKGETVTHEQISRKIRLDSADTEYLYVVSRARQELIQSGIITKSIMGAGYKILNDNEVAKYVYDKYLIASMKKQESALEIIKYVDTNNLNKEELDQLNKLQNLIVNVNTYSANEIVKAQLQLEQAEMKYLEGKKVKRFINFN